MNLQWILFALLQIIPALCIPTSSSIWLLLTYFYLLFLVIRNEHQHAQLHNAHLNFGDWPFGMIVTSLNNSLCEMRTLSSFLTLSNCYRNQLTTSLLQTTWQGTLCFLSFSSHVLHTYSFSSNDLTSEYNPSTNLLYFSSL